MRLSFQQHRQRCGFTLLEVVIVLAIVALLLSVIYSIAQGTLTLADNIRRAQQRESRQQAFTSFCEHWFANLPATAALNLRTTQAGGQYLTALDVAGVRSPFDGSPDRRITLFTEARPGGGLRLQLSCRKQTDPEPAITVTLFDDLGQCEWRAFDPATRQWTTIWNEPADAGARRTLPTLLELTLTQAGASQRQIFWIVPSETLAVKTPQPPTG